MTMTALTNPGDCISCLLAESVRAACGNILVYHAGNFAG